MYNFLEKKTKHLKVKSKIGYMIYKGILYMKIFKIDTIGI